MGSRRVGQDWATSLSLFTFMHWRRKWQPTPVFLPGEHQAPPSLGEQPKQWVSDYTSVLADDGGRVEGDFQPIMTQWGTKHNIPGQGICYHQHVTSANPLSITGVFLTTLVKTQVTLCSEGWQFNAGKGQEAGSSLCCSLKKKNALVLISCDTHRKQSWEYLMMETRE